MRPGLDDLESYDLRSRVHDLKNKVQRALLMIELLELGTKKKREILSILRKDLIELRESLGRLYRDKQFSKEKRGKKKRDSFNPGEIISGLFYRNPSVMIEKADPAPVEGDPHDFESILENLVLNAMEAGAKTIRISCYRKGKCLRIEVTDDGNGIAIEDLPFIFMPGYSTKKGINSNSGYGLYDVYLKALRNDWKPGVVPLEKGCRFFLEMEIKGNKEDLRHDRRFPHHGS